MGVGVVAGGGSLWWVSEQWQEVDQSGGCRSCAGGGSVRWVS